MKLQYIKQAGGVLHPADDHCSEAMTKFKTGEQYEIDIKLTRTRHFIEKYFLFLSFVLITGPEAMNSRMKPGSLICSGRILLFLLDIVKSITG